MKSSFLLALTCSLACVGASDTTNAKDFVSKGDSLLSSGEFQAAISAYDNAVKLEPTNYLYLFKRSAAYMSVGKNLPALEDLETILKLKPGFEGALTQRARLNLKLGKYDSANQDAKSLGGDKGDKILETVKESQDALQNVEKAVGKKDYESCVEQCGIVLSNSPNYLQMRKQRAECRIYQGHVQEALVDLSNVCSLTPTDPLPFVQMADLYYYSLNDYEKAMQSLQKCLRYDPDCKECKKAHRGIKKMNKKLKGYDEKARKKKSSGHPIWTQFIAQLIDEGMYQQVENEAVDVLKQDFNSNIDVSSSKNINEPHGVEIGLTDMLNEALCDALFYTKDYKKGEEYCNRVVAKIPNYTNAILLKAQELLDSEDYEQAVNYLSDSINDHQIKDQKIHNKLREAQTELKRSKTKDYYKILGVSKQSNAKEIKKAYRQKTKEYHPDKYRGELNDEQVARKMSDINEAYEILADDEKRQRYDMGESFEHVGGEGQQQYHPHHAQFFQQGGNPMHFQFHGGGGGGGGNPFGGFDFGSMFAEQFMQQQQQQRQRHGH